MIWNFLSLYIGLNFVIVVLFLIARLSRSSKLNSGVLLRLNYAALVIALTAVCFRSWLPQGELFSAPVKVWAATSSGSVSRTKIDSTTGVLAIGGQTSNLQASAVSVANAASGLLGLLALTLIASLLIETFRLWRLRRESYRIRRIGHVELRASDTLAMPLSFWTPRSATVIVPASLFTDLAGAAHAAVLHELQHHRQADTKWIYLVRGVQGLCAINPFAHLWFKNLSEIQEFACDEALVDRNKVALQAYTGCLLKVAETALQRNERYACATGLTFRCEGSTLRRRIMKMYESKQVLSKWRLAAAVAFATLTLTGVAWATQGVISDRQVTLAQARQMARQSAVSFPIEINDLVVAELNRYVGTPGGRAFMRDSLARMQTHRSVIEPKLREYGVPPELIAVPIVESGYRNLPDDGQRPHGAGLWMFIVSTARSFGLEVEGTVDERLNIPLETDAAMRLLLSEKVRFGSWSLSLIAYNAGDKVVTRGIRALKTRDPWALIRAGYEGDKGYLAKVTAAILIMSDPDSVAE